MISAFLIIFQLVAIKCMNSIGQVLDKTTNSPLPFNDFMEFQSRYNKTYTNSGETSKRWVRQKILEWWSDRIF